MRTSWARSTGNVLDLDCGNGALLANICDRQSGMTPYGVDKSNISLEHAARLLPKFVANFKSGDFFNCDIWSRGPQFALTLIMAGRLLEVEKPIAERLFECLLKTLQPKSHAICFICILSGGLRLWPQ
jgi:trans-aconitate methyltransferase